MIKKILTVLFLVICLTVSKVAKAQTEVVVTGTLGNYHSLGYKAPFISEGIQIESEKPRSLWITSLIYSPTDKILYGDVKQVKGQLNGYLKNRNSLLFGAGFSVSKIWFLDLNDSRIALDPTVSVGVKDKKSRWLVTYDQAIIDYYHRKVLGLEGLYDLKHLRLGARVFVGNFDNRANFDRNIFYSNFVVGYIF